MDKKLRTLDAGMTHAKDDQSAIKQELHGSAQGYNEKLKDDITGQVFKDSLATEA